MEASMRNKISLLFYNELKFWRNQLHIEIGIQEAKRVKDGEKWTFGDRRVLGEILNTGYVLCAINKKAGATYWDVLKPEVWESNS